MKTSSITTIALYVLFLVLISTSFYCKKDDLVSTPEAESNNIYLYEKSITYSAVYLNEYRNNSIRFSNAGRTNIKISSLEIIGKNSDDFSVFNISIITNYFPSTVSVPFELAPLTLAEITIRFAPKDTGLRTAKLEIYNETQNQKSVVDISGNGNLTAISFQNIRIVIKGPHVEKNNDSTRIINEYVESILSNPAYKLAWQNDSFSYFEYMSSNSGKRITSLMGKISLDSDKIEYLEYKRSYDLNNFSQEYYQIGDISFSIKDLSYNSSGLGAMYITIGNKSQEHVIISGYDKKYNWRDSPSKVINWVYNSTIWNDSSYVIVGFY
jgi:hypothetical protein